MIAAAPLDQMLAADPIAAIQRAIVSTLSSLMPGVAVTAHPGKVDLSELLAKSVVQAPGIGIGWSRIKRAGMIDGSFGAAVEWTAYIVAEARMVANRRVEKEAVGIAIGQQLLRILGDDSSFWDRTGVLPPAREPSPELKPFFTIKDAAQGTAYYVVTWTQVAADIGTTAFPTQTGSVNLNDGSVEYTEAGFRDLIASFIPAERDDA